MSNVYYDHILSYKAQTGSKKCWHSQNNYIFSFKIKEIYKHKIKKIFLLDLQVKT